MDTFEELNLHPDLLRGIYAFGFEKPSIIQQKGILPVINKNDIIAQAQSGTGKTATFSIATLQRIDHNSPQCQAIIIAPTRELALQNHKNIFCLSEFLKVRTRCLIGGTDLREDAKALRDGGIQVVVGTPGRIKDLIGKNVLKTDFLKMVILDEADEMLSRGFVDVVREIFETLPADIQVCLFSATMPPEIVEMTDNFMKNPVKILVKNQQLTLEGIKQFYISLQEDSQKFGTLLQLYKNMTIAQCMVFTNRKERVKELAERLAEHKFVVSCISGDMDMAERVNIMREFRSGSTRILISTDLLGRGIDIQQVNLIINYDLPSNASQYIHRIGRSGRFGRKGVAINFVTAGDAQFLANLRQFYNTQIEELPMDLSKIYD